MISGDQGPCKLVAQLDDVLWPKRANVELAQQLGDGFEVAGILTLARVRQAGELGRELVSRDQIVERLASRRLGAECFFVGSPELDRAA
jgi:hypothetical protein